MDPLASLLSRQGFVVLDGGLATEFERRGEDLRDLLWSSRTLLEHPDRLEALHLDWLRAGVHVLATGTYQASFEGLSRRGLSRSECREVFARGVAVARRAASRRVDEGGDPTAVLVAGSLGPYGAALADGSEYRGDYAVSTRDLVDFHRPRVEALLDAGVDLLAFETVPCLAEAEALALLLEDHPTASAWVSFSARDSANVSHGEPLERCVRALEAVRAVVAVGVNCVPPERVAPLLDRARRATSRTLLAYPNLGERWDAALGRWDEATASEGPAHFAPSWWARGLRVMGGCCRTTVEHLRALRSVLDGLAP